MNLAGVLFSWRWPANDGSDGYQRRFIQHCLGGLNRLVKLMYIFNVLASFLPIDCLDMPAISLVAILKILREGNVDIVFD